MVSIFLLLVNAVINSFIYDDFELVKLHHEMVGEDTVSFLKEISLANV